MCSQPGSQGPLSEALELWEEATGCTEHPHRQRKGSEKVAVAHPGGHSENPKPPALQETVLASEHLWLYLGGGGVLCPSFLSIRNTF